MAFNTDLRTNDSLILLNDLTTHVLKHSHVWLLVDLVLGMVWYYRVAQAALNVSSYFPLSFSPLYTLALFARPQVSALVECGPTFPSHRTLPVLVRLFT